MGFLSKLKKAVNPVKVVKRAFDNPISVLKDTVKAASRGDILGALTSPFVKPDGKTATGVSGTPQQPPSAAFSPLTPGGGVSPLFGQVPPDNFFQSPTALSAFVQSLQAPQSGYTPVGFGNGGGAMGMQQLFADISNRSTPQWGNRGSPTAPAVIFDPTKYAF